MLLIWRKCFFVLDLVNAVLPDYSVHAINNDPLSVFYDGILLYDEDQFPKKLQAIRFFQFVNETCVFFCLFFLLLLPGSVLFYSVQ